MSLFENLFERNVDEHVEKKNGLSYLSWAWAWAEIKKACPGITYTIYENSQGWNYHTDGRTCWVKTGVTVEGLEYIEYLPVMDYNNHSIPLEKVTSFDVNKAIQRSLTKAIARHGLGLYIYAGEDLPDESKDQTYVPQTKPSGDKPTDKQLEMIAKLLLERGMTINQFGFASLNDLNRVNASSILDKLFKMPKKEQPRQEPHQETSKFNDSLPF